MLLSPEEAELVFKLHCALMQFVSEQLKEHMILLSCDGTPTAYGVTGLIDPMERVIGRLPAMIETVLLPFRGKITYDGIVSGFNVTLGPCSGEKLCGC